MKDVNMKTDLQKFQEFFDKMNIRYSTYRAGGNTYIDVDNIHLIHHDSASLSVCFDEDENFIEFETWGE